MRKAERGSCCAPCHMLPLLLLSLPWAACVSLPPRDALLRVRIASMQRDSFCTWLSRRPFSAVLPVQPMLIQPLREPLFGLELTFRRKPSSEKGGVDGGLRFTVAADPPDSAGPEGVGVLLVTRISDGQYTGKGFSERLCGDAIRTSAPDLSRARARARLKAA